MIQRFRQYLIDSYNGLYKIVIEPYMPTKLTVILLVVGLVIGLLWGYSLRPVSYYDGSPYQLSQGDRDQWIKLVASSYYSQMYDAETAKSLLVRVERPAEAIDRLLPNVVGVEQQALQQLRPLAEEVGVGREAPRPGSFIGSILDWLLPALLIVVLTPIAVVVWRLLIYPNIFAPLIDRLRPKSQEELLKRKELEEEKKVRLMQIEAQKNLVVQVDEQLGQPLMQKLSIYTKGRVFDDSFAIEDKDENFLGECGAAKAKTLGDNELAGVEIWLFDKEDFANTWTKAFLSEYVYNDPAARAEVENKVDNPATDLVMVREGAKLVLDTDALRVQATVKSVSYSATPGLPPNSVFENLQIEIAAWYKVGKGVPSAAPAPVPAAYAPPPMSPPPPTFTPQTMPTAAPPPTYAPPPPSQSSPTIRPLSPPPFQAQPPQDDDPFGGTGDFTPINNG